MHAIKQYRDEWRIQEYLLITFFISWLSWGILCMLTNLQVISFNSPLGIILFVLGGFGPTISAIMCIEGKITFKKIREFIFSRKKRTILYFLALAIIMIAIVMLSSSMQTNPDMPWYVLPIVLLVCTFVGGGNEELGWRGTLQPIMERVIGRKAKHPIMGFMVATLIVGVIWAIWHLPLWFVVGSTQQNLPFFLFAAAAIAESFWLAYIFRTTHSVFYCMLIHGLTNVLMSFFVIEVNWILVAGYLATTIATIFIGARSTPKKVTYEHD